MGKWNGNEIREQLRRENMEGKREVKRRGTVMEGEREKGRGRRGG